MIRIFVLLVGCVERHTDSIQRAREAAGFAGRTVVLSSSQRMVARALLVYAGSPVISRSTCSCSGNTTG